MDLNEQQTENSEIRTDKKPRSVGYVFLFVVIAGLFVLAAVFHIDQYAKVLRINNEIRQLEKKYETLQETKKRLELQEAEICSYQNVYEGAQKSGMIYPKDSQIFWLKNPVEPGVAK